MTVFLPTEYEITNNNAEQVRLNIASHQIRVAAGQTVKFHTPNRLGTLPDIPGVDVTQNDLTDVYIPFGGFLTEAEVIGAGDTSEVNFTGFLADADVDKGSLSITDGTETFTDSDGDGILTGSGGGTGTINYNTGEFNVTFNAAPASVDIEATYVHRLNETIR